MKSMLMNIGIAFAVLEKRPFKTGLQIKILILSHRNDSYRKLELNVVGPI